MLLIISTCFWSDVQSITFNNDIIEKKSRSIENAIIRDRCIMYSFTAISCAHEAYQWYPLLASFIHTSPPVVIAPQEKLSFIESLKSSVVDLFCTKEGMKSLIQTLFAAGGFLVISSMAEKFLHPDTLRWYIHAHAPYHITIKLMREQIIDTDSIADENVYQLRRDMVDALFERLIRQAELVCSYITYKNRCLDSANCLIGKRCLESIVKVHLYWLSRIERLLQVNTVDIVLLQELLDGYEKALQVQVDHFALVEGETKHEKKSVETRMKTLINRQE